MPTSLLKEVAPVVLSDAHSTLVKNQSTSQPNPPEVSALALPQGFTLSFGMDSNDYDQGDELAQPYAHDNWCEDLQDVSGLDTSPESALFSPPGLAMEECTSYAMVICRVAER